jgi:hypothetical protein
LLSRISTLLVLRFAREQLTISPPIERSRRALEEKEKKTVENRVHLFFLNNSHRYIIFHFDFQEKSF